jgi:hypothetical protein
MHKRIIKTKSWTDEEPDTFTMSVWLGRRTKEKFLVVSGNATWLTTEQALEVHQFLTECLIEMTLPIERD